MNKAASYREVLAGRWGLSIRVTTNSFD